MLVLFCVSPVLAEEAAPKCTFKNTDLCGTWISYKGFKTAFLGHIEKDHDGSIEHCLILKEERQKDRPFSLIRCSKTIDYKQKLIVTGFYLITTDYYTAPYTSSSHLFLREYIIERMPCVVLGSPYQMAAKEFCNLEQLEKKLINSYTDYSPL